MSISAALRSHVRERAAARCEYCRMPEEYDPAPFEIDHIIPEKMDGPTVPGNLAFACFKCNNHKGPNIAGIDPATKDKSYLFDPRSDHWAEHFRWEEANLNGLTPKGRTTIELLRINESHRVALRHQLILEGAFPDDS